MEGIDMSENEREGVMTVSGKPRTLLGPELRVGDVAPNFRVADGAFKSVSLADFKGRPVLISVVPSLDTGLCAKQTIRFNQELASMPADVVVLTISRDLAFAQKRFCEAEKIDRALVLTDAVWLEFGEKYGVLIKDMGLLARSVFLVDREGLLQHVEIVPEMSDPPDYDTALDLLKGLV
jgi:thiol peroxidase